MRTTASALTVLAVLVLQSYGLPISGEAALLTGEQKRAVAEQLSKDLTGAEVTAVDNPIIKDDKNPAIFKITPRAKSGLGSLFSAERYEIIAKPDDTAILGNDLCYYVQNFIESKQKEKIGRYLKWLSSIPISFKGVNFEIKEDSDALKDIVYSIISLAVQMDEDDYKNFEIFTRGFADAARTPFRRKILATHPYDKVVGLPPEPGDTTKSIYIRPQQTLITIENGEYGNKELPNLRGRFMSELVGRFLATCQGSGPPMRTEVLDGSVIDAKQPDFRTIELFFYAHGP